MPHFDTGPFMFGGESKIFYDGKEVTPEEAAKICEEKVEKLLKKTKKEKEE